MANIEPSAEGEWKLQKTFKDYGPGYGHVNGKYLTKLADQAIHIYLSPSIEVKPDKSATSVLPRDNFLHLVRRETGKE